MSHSLTNSYHQFIKGVYIHDGVRHLLHLGGKDLSSRKGDRDSAGE